jgi:hypothetical protein
MSRHLITSLLKNVGSGTMVPAVLLLFWPRSLTSLGDYEGLLSSEIKAKNPTWSIWDDVSNTYPTITSTNDGEGLPWWRKCGTNGSFPSGVSFFTNTSTKQQTRVDNIITKVDRFWTQKSLINVFQGSRIPQAIQRRRTAHQRRYDCRSRVRPALTPSYPSRVESQVASHFSRVLISRWINFPLCLGKFTSYLMRVVHLLALISGTHFNVEPGGNALSYTPFNRYLLLS